MTKKTVVIILSTTIVVVGALYYRFVYRPPGPRVLQSNPFEGFKILDVPRSDVDIGATWKQGVGPVEGSQRVSRVLTRSLQTSEFESQSTFDASVIAALLKSLDISTNGSTELKQSLKLKGLSIVTVANASSLSTTVGNAYLWETVRVDQLSITSSKAEHAKVSANLKAVAKAESIAENATGADSVEMTATGTKLFVAYRVVVIGQPTLAIEDSTDVTEPTSAINLGNEYTVKLEKAISGETIFTKDCAVNVIVTSYLQLNAESKPTQTTQKVSCGKRGELVVDLPSTSGSQRATMDALRIANLKVWPDDEGQAKAVGKFEVEHRTIALETLDKPWAPGW